MIVFLEMQINYFFVKRQALNVMHFFAILTNSVRIQFYGMAPMAA